MAVINRIKKNHTNATIPRCSEIGCHLRLNGLNNYVVLKGEKICKDRKICDCIIFTSDNYITVGIVELKSKTIHSSEIVEKLTNGLKTALDILEECNDDCMRYEFYHIVLCKRWRTAEYEVITHRKIQVKGKRYNIIPKKCGISFSNVISGLR
jgi:hypothetical protein